MATFLAWLIALAASDESGAPAAPVPVIPAPVAPAPDSSMSGPVSNVDEVLDGLPAGRNRGVRAVGSEVELDRVHDDLVRGGVPIEVPGYPGSWVERPDGVRIGLRDSSKSGGRTIDIRYPDGSTGKVHIE